MAQEEESLKSSYSAKGTSKNYTGKVGKGGSKLTTEGTTKSVMISIKEGVSKKEAPVRKLSDVEYKEKRDKGLCLSCDDKYFHGHKFKLKKKQQLNLFIMHDEEEWSDDEQPEDTEEVEGKKLEVTDRNKTEAKATDSVEVSLRSLLGFSSKGTTKMKGVVNGREVVVMINCGATHNFIHQKLVSELDIPVFPTSSYGIVVGNGTVIQGKGIYGCSW